MEKHTVILVEDEMSFYMAAKNAIESVCPGCTIISCDTEEQAIENISEHESFDLLVLDGNLWGGGHGKNVLIKLSEHQLKKTVVFSANDDFVSMAASQGVLTLHKGSNYMKTMEETFSKVL